MTSERSSILDAAPLYPPDEVFNLTQEFMADYHADKILLGRGAYEDEQGNPWVLPSVAMAHKVVHGSGHEYLPISGLKSFRQLAVDLVFHDTKALNEGRISSCQAVSGSGALFMLGAALREIDPSPRTILVSSPTWPNHIRQFEALGFTIEALPYYKDKTFAFQDYVAAIKASRPRTPIILHACAHNPTGCDPDQEQWKVIAAAVKEKELFPIFDAAYLGFNSGSVQKDSWAIRHFVEGRGLEAAVCISFAKSMGLYGERIGLVAFVTNKAATVPRLDSVLERVQRATISTPPAYGAKLVSAVLGTPELKAQWDEDIVTMSSRISCIRQELYGRLLALGTPGDWTHIVSQTGMFSFLGLSPKQVGYLRDTCHIYMLESSRIAMTGLNHSNLDRFAHAVDMAVRKFE